MSRCRSICPSTFLGLFFLLAGPVCLGAFEPHLFVAGAQGLEGGTDALALESPWLLEPELGPADHWATLRHFFGLHYIVNRNSGTVRVVDPTDFSTVNEFSVGADTMPVDILVVDPSIAYVSRRDSTLLWKGNPSTGEQTGSIDLSQFADRDGLPEMQMMARYRDWLLLQIQREDRPSGNPADLSFIAVIDMTTDTLVDADPSVPGSQGIELTGTLPWHKMTVFEEEGLLFVVAPGPRLDTSGGIEEIDLEELRSLGFILSEEVVADLGPFFMMTPDEGWGVFHTDIAPSSHLIHFDRSGYTPFDDEFLNFNFIRALDWDPVTRQLFFPDPTFGSFGIEIANVDTGERISDLIPTSRPPWDLVVARGTHPGEVRDLRVFRHDASTMDLTYTPACESADHRLLYGLLEDISAYDYFGDLCALGTSGQVPGVPLLDGSWFFLIAASGAAGTEGPYGRSSSGVQRPAFSQASNCNLPQILTTTCD